MKDTIKTIALSAAVSLAVSLSSFLVLAQMGGWTEPSATPPDGNVPAPLNVGGEGQAKSGGLILNTGGAANGLIVDKGNVGIGISNPNGRLHILSEPWDYNAGGGKPLIRFGDWWAGELKIGPDFSFVAVGKGDLSGNNVKVLFDQDGIQRGPYSPMVLFGGMYSVGSDTNNDFRNPLTNDFSCPTAYTSYQAVRARSAEPERGINLYYCLRKTWGILYTDILNR